MRLQKSWCGGRGPRFSRRARGAGSDGDEVMRRPAAAKPPSGSSPMIVVQQPREVKKIRRASRRWQIDSWRRSAAGIPVGTRRAAAIGEGRLRRWARGGGAGDYWDLEERPGFTHARSQAARRW